MAAVAAPLRDDANQAEQEFLRLQLEAVREHIREHEDPDAAFARRLFLQDIQERLAELRQVRDHHAHHRPILAAPQNHRRMPVANFREHRQHIRAAQRQPPPGADVIDVDSLPDDDIQEVVTLDVGDEQAQKACVSCSDDFSVRQLAHLPCDHDYCGECLTTMFRNAMTDESMYPPRCCQEITPVQARRVLDNDFYREYRAKLPELMTKDRTYCHIATCAVFIPPQQIINGVARCPTCRTTTCSVCKAASHDGDCPADTETQAILDMAAGQNWRRCSQCRTMVELNTGCNHITCRCGHHFCYTCGVRWKTCHCPVWDERNIIRQAGIPQNLIPILPHHIQRPPVNHQAAADRARQLQAELLQRRRRQMELMNQQMGLLVGAEQGLQDAHGEMLGFLHRAPPLAAEPQRPRDAQAQEQYARDRQAPQAGALQVQLEHARRIRMQQNLQHAHIRRQLERLEPYVADNEIPGVQENPQHGEAGPAARGIPVLGQAQRQAQVVPPAPGTPRSEAYALPPLHRIDHHPRPLPVEPLAWREFGMPRDFLGVPGAAGDAARPARQANTVPPARVVNGPETVPAVAAGNGMPAQIRDIFHRQQQALGARNPNPRSVRAVRMGDLVELASRRPNHYVAGHGRDIGRIIPTREDYAARPQVVPDPVDGGAPAAAVGSNARPAAGPAPDIVDLVSDSETVTEGETDDDENALPLRSNVIDLTNDPEAVPKGGLRPRSRTRYLPNALAPVVPRNLAHPPWVRDRHVYLDSDEDDDTFLAPPAQRRRIVHEDPQDSDNERRERLGYFGADRNGNDSEREMGGQGAGAPARVVAGTRLPHDMDIW